MRTANVPPLPPLTIFRNVAFAHCERCDTTREFSRLVHTKVFVGFGATQTDGVRILPNRRIMYETPRRLVFRRYTHMWLCAACRTRRSV